MAYIRLFRTCRSLQGILRASILERKRHLFFFFSAAQALMNEIVYLFFLLGNEENKALGFLAAFRRFAMRTGRLAGWLAGYG